MSNRFVKECKKRIAEAGVEPREIKVEVNHLPIYGRRLGEIRRETPVVIRRMVEEFKNPSEYQKLYEANLQLEEVKKEANYWETKCEKINRIMIKYKVENRDLEKKIADLEHENAHLKIKYEEVLKKETRFETSYTKKHSELVKEAASLRKENETLIRNYELLHGAYTNVEKNATELREEKGNLNRTLELLNEHLETMENNTSVFIDEINTLWGEIVNIDLESKDGKEKFKELQIQVAKSKNLLDLAFSIK